MLRLKGFSSSGAHSGLKSFAGLVGKAETEQHDHDFSVWATLLEEKSA